MKTVIIPESEYLQMQQTIEILQQQLRLLQDQLKWYPALKHVELQPMPPSSQPVSIKRGSAKAIITYIAEDFTAPLPDFQDYTS
jgi:hypothetical protein